MKRILLTTVSLGVLGLVSPALGADLPYAKAPVVAAPVYDWTGFYVGGFGGGGLGNHNYNNANGPTGAVQITRSTMTRRGSPVAASSATTGKAATT